MSGRSGARAPVLVEVIIQCPKTGITAKLFRPGYKTPQKGTARCPHCAAEHPYELDYDPSERYAADAPKVKQR